MIFWNPFAGGWFCDRGDEEDCLLGEAHAPIEGAVVPRPADVVSAVMLRFEPRRLDALPLNRGRAGRKRCRFRRAGRGNRHAS
ncbi:hypothetical protein SLA_6527 [Streptomyces laurentii]|uniref:Uncharacterized protein n=1 Tax=Streptomyces laurentii TaxID=39478 RepID=A0A160P8X5_STRLU|nr:hypothetical protein SLA_6527 [Streptomyces laurentii]